MMPATVLKQAVCRWCWRLQHHAQKAPIPPREEWSVDGVSDCECDAMPWIPDDYGLDSEHRCAFFRKASGEGSEK